MADFEQLIQLGQSQALHGWDFSWLNARTREEGLPWDYRARVLERMRDAHSLLDVGTGGGEFLASLAPLPELTCATEGYPPNVGIARSRLKPLGVQVVDVSEIEDGRLPFDSVMFDLVIDRHEGVRADELFRVLAPGGHYITQQVGGENCMDLNRFLEDQPTYAYAGMTLDQSVRELEQAGLRVLEAREVFPRYAFLDVAGVVFYLKAIPWQIPGFTVEAYHERLFHIHETIQQEGAFTVREHRWLVEAVRQ